MTELAQLDDWITPAEASPTDDWTTPEEPWDKLNTFQRTGAQLQSGYEGAKQGLAAGSLKSYSRGLTDLDAQPAVPPTPAPGSSPHSRGETDFSRMVGRMAPEARDTFRGELQTGLGTAVGDIVSSQAKQRTIPRNPRSDAMMEAINAGEYGAAAGHFASDPIGVVAQIGNESLVANAPVMAGAMAVGGLAGAVPAMMTAALGTYGIDIGPRALEVMMNTMRAAGVDVTNPEAVKGVVQRQPWLVRRAFNDAGMGSVAVAGVQALTQGLTRPLSSALSPGQNISRVGQNLGMHMVGEPVGEAAAQLATSGEITDPAGVVAEALGGGPMTIADTITQTLANRQAGLFSRPGPTVQMTPGQSYPEPPALGLPGPVPPAGGPTPGVGPTPAPPPGSTPPPSPAGVSPAGGPSGPVSPNIVPGSAGPMVQPAPAAPPPEPPNPLQGKKASLAEALADPRTNEQIAADAALAQQQALDQARGTLPPGFGIAQVGDEWVLTDPAGGIVESSLGTAPGADMLAQWSAAAADLNQAVDFSPYTRVGTGTRGEPVVAQQPTDIAAAADLVTGQTLGHVMIGPLNVSIQFPLGSERNGTSDSGEIWSTQMPADYGYIKRSQGADGEQVDVYLGPQAHQAAQHQVFVVDQINPDTGEFDEHKAMIGFPSQATAQSVYGAAFSDGSGPSRIGAVTPMSFDQFVTWVRKGDTKKAIAYEPPPPPPLTVARQRALYDRPLTLIEFLAASGGIRDSGGELASLGLVGKFVPKIGALVRPNGRPLDYARELAEQAGYLRAERPNQPNQNSTADLLNLLAEEASGRPIYTPEVQAEMDAARQAEWEALVQQRYEEAAATLAQALDGSALVVSPDQMHRATILILEGYDTREAVTRALLEEHHSLDDEFSALADQDYINAIAHGLDLNTELAAAGPVGTDDHWDIPFTWEPENEDGTTIRPSGEAGAEPTPPSVEATGTDTAAAPQGDGGSGPVGSGQSDQDTQGGPRDTPAGERPADQQPEPASAPEPEQPTGRDTPGSTEGAAGPVQGTERPSDDGGEQTAEADTGPAPVDEGSIGKNVDGDPIYVDERGVRFTRTNGIRSYEPVAMSPDGRMSTRPEADKPSEFRVVAEAPDGGRGNTPPETETLKPRSEGSIAQAFADAFLAGRSFASIQQARAFIAEKTGTPIKPGTVEAKEADEAIELGVVLAARQIVAETRSDQAETFDRLLKLYGQQPNLNVRTAGSIERQAYSTPVPLAWVASQLAGITPSTVVYEPTAGNGALLIGAHASLVAANELDADRAAALREQGFGRVTSDDATTKNVGRHFRAVIANPPFGAVRGDDGQTVRYDMGFVQNGYNTGEVDHAIALRALDAMSDDGRAVLILGGINKLVRTPKGRADAYNGKAKREFFKVLYDNYNVVDHFTVPGELYAKQGAAWPVDVIVIDGRGKSALPLPAVTAPRVVPTWDAIKEVMLNADITSRPDVAVPGQGTGMGDSGQPAGDSGAVAPGGSQGPSTSVGLPGASVPAPGVDDTDRGRPRGSGVRTGTSSTPGGGVGRPDGVPGSPGESGDTHDGGEPDVRGPVQHPGPATDGALSSVPQTGGRPGDQGRDDGGLVGVGNNQSSEQPGVRSGKRGGRGGGGGGGGRGTGSRGNRSGTGRAEERQKTAEELEEEFRRKAEERARRADERARERARREQEEREWWRNWERTRQNQRPPPGQDNQNTGPRDGETVPQPLDADGRYPLVEGDFVASMAGIPIVFQDQKAAAAWIIRVGHKNSYDQVFEIANHPLATGQRGIFTARERDRVANPDRKPNNDQKPPEDDDAPSPPPPPPPPPREKAAPVDAEAKQVPYNPGSEHGNPVGTLVPTNLASQSETALANLAKKLKGGIDAFVRDKLGYTDEELYKYFSSEQIDAIALAIEQVDQRQGFIIGDQTGVGKGRVVAAMIRYAERTGLVPIFVTEKLGLYVDMGRDLTDIGMADIIPSILATNNGLKLPLTDKPDGPRLSTGAKDIHERLLADVAQHVARTGKLPERYRVIMTTYNQMQTVKGVRPSRTALVSGLASGAFVIMDESHNAGGSGAASMQPRRVKGVAEPVITRSLFFRWLVNDAASVFFSSATWAKRPEVMDLYAAKTAMRAAVDSLATLADVIKFGGVPMQQIVTSQLAQMGQYIRRERSFDGVTYDVVPIPVDQQTYSDVSTTMAAIFRISEEFVKPAIEQIDGHIRTGAGNVGPDGSVGGAGADSTSFGSVMHNLINQMLLASKAQGTADRAIELLKDDKKVVIALATTMGSFLDAYAKENDLKNGDVVDLTFNALLLRYLHRTLRWTEKKPFSDEPAIVHWLVPEDLGPEGAALYRQTEALITRMDLSKMPISPIDHIRAELAKAGYSFGELTGRTNGLDYRADGRTYYRTRPPREGSAAGRQAVINGFNGGTVDTIIVNQSGATGLSLHASEKFKDQRKRYMLIAQAEADIAIFMQMLGRIHRTGQVVTPAYEQLFADVPAERRPAAVLAAKMASLNASSTSSRKAALSADNTPDFMNKYGGQVILGVLEEDPRLEAILGLGEGDFGDLENLARKFTGRLPILPPVEQARLLDEVEARYLALIEEMEAAGENPLEARTLDLGARAIEKRQLSPARGPTSNLFAAAVDMEKFDVKRLVRPPAPEQIVVDLARAMGDKDMTVEDLRDDGIEQLSSKIGSISLMEGEPQIETLIEGVQAAVDREVAREFTDPTARDRHLLKVSANQNRITSFLREAVPGTVIDIDAGGDLLTQRGLVLNAQLKGKSGNAPSNYEITVITDEGIRRRLTGSNIFTPDTAPQSAMPDGGRIIRQSQTSVKQFLETLSDGTRGSREDRWILTGNILAGFALRTGQIINFTTDEGEIRQGVMMARDFDPEAAANDVLPVFDERLAYEFLTDPSVDLPFVRSADNVLRIAKDTSGYYQITMPSSRARGGPYFLDRGLQSAVAPSQFVASGGTMRARVPPGPMLRAAIDNVIRIMTTQETHFVSNHGQARQWHEANSGGGARFSQDEAPMGWGAIEADNPLSEEFIQAALDAVQKVLGPNAKVQTTSNLMSKFLPGGQQAIIRGFAVGGLIRVSLAPEGATRETFPWTLHHEAVHALRALGLFTEGEWKALEAAVAMYGWIDRFNLRARYPGLAEDKIVEEAIAEAFAAYSTDPNAVPKGVLTRVWAKIKRFIAAFRNALNGRGFNTAEDVFDRMMAGKVGSRRPQTETQDYRTMKEAEWEADWNERTLTTHGEDAPWDQQTGTRGPQSLDEARDRAGAVEERLTIPDENGNDVDLMLGMSPELERRIREGADRGRAVVTDLVARLWSGTKIPDGVEAVSPETKPDMNFFTDPVKPPRIAFRGTGLEHVIRAGVRAEEKQSAWIKRLVKKYEGVRKALQKAGGDFDKVSEALIDADADQVDIQGDEVARNDLFDAWALTEDERKAFMGVHQLLDTIVRFVDNHRRAMLPNVRAQKQAAMDALDHLLGSAKVSGSDARRLYRERAVLTKRIADGTSIDPAADSRRIEAINAELRRARAADPANAERIAELQDTIDQLEARLNATSLRGRIKGYIPHKFYGSWRLWRIEAPEEEGGEPTRHEITSNQGFYNSREEAIRAARRVLKDDPTARLRIGPKQIHWPEGIEGTELSDMAHRRLTAGLAEAAGLEGPALHDLMSGVARRRNRRRVLASALERTGAAGYSRDMDRIIRTHIGQAARYVTMDRMKYMAITASEREGLSPYRRVTQDRPVTQRMFEAWFRDLNGGKQPHEAAMDSILTEGYRAPSMPIIDDILRRFRVPIHVVTAGAVGYTLMGGYRSPYLATALAGYLGYKMYKILTGRSVPWREPTFFTDFPTRAFVSSQTSAMAHAKLGMLINIKSALVNLTQTAVFTWPELGSHWTGVGMQRAAKAMWNATRGVDNADTRLMERAGIESLFRVSESGPVLAQEESRLAKWSMWPFQTAENSNRATAFFGGYERALSEGKSPGDAMEEGVKVMRKTQFPSVSADKAEILRQQWARMPLQFKNFMVHAIARMFELTIPQLTRMVVALTVLGGALALPGFQIMNQLSKLISGWDMEQVVEREVLNQHAAGNMPGNIATILAHGLPAYFTDISKSVGMGAGFLPMDAAGWMGPWIGTIKSQQQANEANAGIVDRLALASPSFNWLKSLEAAANGRQITSAGFYDPSVWGDGQSAWTDWRKKNATLYSPSTGQLIGKALNFTPPGETLMRSMAWQQAQKAQEHRKDAKAYMSDIVQAVREGRYEDAGKIAVEANQEGHQISYQQVWKAAGMAMSPQVERVIKNATKADRPELFRQGQGVDRQLGR